MGEDDDGELGLARGGDRAGRVAGLVRRAVGGGRAAAAGDLARAVERAGERRRHAVAARRLQLGGVRPRGGELPLGGAGARLGHGRLGLGDRRGGAGLPQLLGQGLAARPVRRDLLAARGHLALDPAREAHGPALEVPGDAGQARELGQRREPAGGRRARLAQQPHERLRVLPRPVLADRDVAVDDAHRRVVGGEVGREPRGVDGGARRPAAEAVGLERRVRRGRHPAVAAHVVPDVRRATARHRLDDAAAVAHDDVGVEHQRRGVVRRLGERAADGELEPELRARRGEHRPPLRRQVVAERQHLQRALADGHARREDVEVDGLGQAVERQRERLRAEAAGHPLVERDRRGADARDLRRQLDVVHGRVREEELRDAGQPLGELERADRVLHEDPVGRGGQLVEAVGDLHPGQRRGEAGVDLVGVQRHVVPEPLQVRRDGQQVGLAAAGGVQPVRGEDQAQPAA